MTDETTQPETVSMPSQAAPVAPAAPAVPAPRGRRRWYAAIGVAALAIVAIVAVAFLAGRGGIVAGAPDYLPATTVAYADVRLDMPGDQRAQVAQLLSRFPGFADQAAFESKLDETFDRLLSQVGGGGYTYTGDVKPWFSGQVALAITSLPDFSGGTSSVPALGLIGVKDATKARTSIEGILDKARAQNARVSEEAFEGATLWTIEDPSARTPELGRAALALTADMIIVGQDPAAVRASVTLRAKGGDTLAGSSAFQEALKPLAEARLGTFYVDGAALKATLSAVIVGVATGMPGLDTALAAFPERIVGALRVEDGRVLAEVRSTLPESAERPAGHASDLALRVPAKSLVYVEVHDVGQAIEGLVTQLKSMPGIADLTDQLKPVEGILGTSLESFLDWVGDVAIVVGVEGDQPRGALVAQVTDIAVAGQRLGQLGALIQLAALDPSAGIHVTTSKHADATITEFRIDQVPGLAIAWALKGETFVIGVGAGSVEAVLDVTEATSLGADARYKDALAAGGAPTNSGILYIDLAAARSAVEAFIPTAERARYEQDARPWLEPFDRLIAVYFQDGRDAVARTTLITQ
jgi:hypothetical protein